MKTSIQSGVIILLFATFISCTKENIKSGTSPQISQATISQSSDLSTQQKFHIGDHFGGGIIFYIDTSKKHGLIAATADQGHVAWYNGVYLVTGAKGIAIGTGRGNTNKIVNKQGNTGNYAAKLCADYADSGFTDWYLPSKNELNQLFIHRGAVGGLEATNYWSSTESDINNAFDEEFGGGFRFADDKSFTLNVRAIRSF